MGVLLRVMLCLALLAVWMHPTHADLNHVDVINAKVNSVSEPFRDENGKMVQRVDETLTLVETMPDGSRQRSKKQLFPLIGLAIKGIAMVAKGAKVASAIAKGASAVHKGVKAVQGVQRVVQAAKQIGQHRSNNNNPQRNQQPQRNHPPQRHRQPPRGHFRGRH